MAKNRLSSLAKDTAIYGLSSIIGRFLNYLLVPLYTNKISAESGGYGVVTNLYAYTALFLVILTFGMETTFFRFSNKEGVNPDKTFSTSGWVVGLVALVFVALVSIFLTPIANALNYATHPEYVEIMAIIVALDAFQAILFARLRYESRPIKFASLKLLFIALNIGMNLFIFFVAPVLKESLPALMGWYESSYQVGYIFIVNLICTTLVTLGFIPELRKLKHGIDKDLLKQMWKYTAPLLLLGLAGILNQVADKICYRFIVPGEEGDVQLGIYGACVKIAMIMAMITQAFRYAYEPFVFGGKQDTADKATQAKVMKYFIVFTLLAFLAVVMYMPILKYIIGPDYREGLRVVPIVMMAEIFMGIYFNLSFWYKLTDQTWWGAVFSGIGCAVLLAINFIFVPKYGYMACAWGGFAGYGVCMVLSFIVGKIKAPIPYDLKSAFVYFALAIGLYFAQKYIHIESTIWTLVVNTGLLLVFFAFICWKEKDLLKGGKPSEDSSEEPKQDASPAEQPKAEEPKTEQPITEQPKAEQPDSQETPTPNPVEESPAAAPASQPAASRQPEPPKKPKKEKSIEELRREIKATTLKALDSLFLSAPNICSMKQVIVWADAGATTFVGFTDLEQEMKEQWAIEKGYEFKKVELRQGRPENEKDARKLNIEGLDVFLQVLNYEENRGGKRDPIMAKKARIEIFGGRGDLEKPFYELSSEELQKANRSYYNIGRSEFPDLGSGSYRQNHIVVSDTLRPEINGYASRAHARIGFSNNIGFFLQVERGGSRPLSGNRTRIIREEEQIEMEDTMVKEPLQTGDLIELGKHVVLLFTEIETEDNNQ